MLGLLGQRVLLILNEILDVSAHPQRTIRRGDKCPVWITTWRTMSSEVRMSTGGNGAEAMIVDVNRSRNRPPEGFEAIASERDSTLCKKKRDIHTAACIRQCVRNPGFCIYQGRRPGS